MHVEAGGAPLFLHPLKSVPNNGRRIIFKENLETKGGGGIIFGEGWRLVVCFSYQKVTF
jgi:hypothetical protein